MFWGVRCIRRGVQTVHIFAVVAYAEETLSCKVWVSNGSHFCCRHSYRRDDELRWVRDEDMPECPVEMRAFVAGERADMRIPCRGDVDMIMGGPPCQGVSGIRCVNISVGQECRGHVNMSRGGHLTTPLSCPLSLPLQCLTPMYAPLSPPNAEWAQPQRKTQ